VVMSDSVGFAVCGSGAGLSSCCCGSCEWLGTAAATGVTASEDCGAGAVVGVCSGVGCGFGSGARWESAAMRMAKLRLPVFGAGAALLADGAGAGVVDWSVVALVGESWTEVELVGGAVGSGIGGTGRAMGICGICASCAW
jgi:hypothetical protein